LKIQHNLPSDRLPQLFGPGSALPPTPSNTSPETCDGQSHDVQSRQSFLLQPSTPTGNSERGIGVSCPNPAENSFGALTNPGLLSPVQMLYPGSRVANAAPSAHGEMADGAGGMADSEEGVIPLQKVNWEHHGSAQTDPPMLSTVLTPRIRPWSWVSVCSRPGLRWVCDRARTDEFVEIANGLTKTWSRRLKMKRFQNLKAKAPELDRALAAKYVAGKHSHQRRKHALAHRSLHSLFRTVV